jgi:hypothetical protein
MLNIIHLRAQILQSSFLFCIALSIGKGKGKGKGKEQATKTQKGRRGKVLLFL